MSNYPQRITNWFLDIIFPKKCLGCNKFTNSCGRFRVSRGQSPSERYSRADFDYVCRKCFGEIPLKNGFECVGCKRDTRLGLTCAFCAKENQIDQLIIVADLSNPVLKKMLKAYKYKFIKNMALPLSMLANKRIKKLIAKDFKLFESNPPLVPVPLYKRRFNERGFNQAELLAENLADTYHIVCESHILTRIANPKHQAEIKKKEERINNVRGNFFVKDKKAVSGRTIILVDDICTSGATLNECARVLKENGAKRVIGFVIARGQFKK